jgi:phosphate-selective porin
LSSAPSRLEPGAEVADEKSCVLDQQTRQTGRKPAGRFVQARCSLGRGSTGKPVYNTRGGFFNQVSPLRPVFQGGPGAWEIVTRFSYIDLDSAALHGGKFSRFTPMVNWHMSDNVRVELTYGYGSLDGFALVGKTQFFQTRLQLQL